MRPPAVAKKQRASSAHLASPAASQQPLKKGPWTAEEDAILKDYVSNNGEGNWNALQKDSRLQRCGKSCRLRWVNNFRPNLKKESFSPEEEMHIIRLHAQLGNKWANMAKQLPGRTDNEIKNYWNTRVKQRKRAGLPLYPPEIQQQILLMSHGKCQNEPWVGNSQSALKPLQSTKSAFVSDMPLFSENQYGFILQDPNRGKNNSINFPFLTTTVENRFETFNFGPPPCSVNELPSSQFSSDFGSEQMPQCKSGLLDDLVQESYRDGQLLSSKCLAIDLFHQFSYLGIKMVKEMLEADEPELIDMLVTGMAPPTPKTVLPDWCNNLSSGGEFSNCPSSVTTDEEIGLDNINWNSMPGNF